MTNKINTMLVKLQLLVEELGPKFEVRATRTIIPEHNIDSFHFKVEAGEISGNILLYIQNSRIDIILGKLTNNESLINTSFSYNDEPEKVDEYLEKFRKILLEN